MKTKKIIYSILVLFVVVFVLIFLSLNLPQKDNNKLTGNIFEQTTPISTSKAIPTTTTSQIDSNETEAYVAPTANGKKSVKSYRYLFVNEREPMTGNIVGYFGNGSFIWYVPDWLMANWHEVIDNRMSTIVWTPNVRIDPYIFTDIEFYIATSTEKFNAAYLYEQDKSTSMGSYQVTLKEVVLNYRHILFGWWQQDFADNVYRGYRCFSTIFG